MNSTIKADKLVIKLDSEKSGKGAQAIRQDKGNLTIDANVDIDVKGDNSTMGIYSHAGSTTVNGDVKVVLDGKRGGFTSTAQQAFMHMQATAEQLAVLLMLTAM